MEMITGILDKIQAGTSDSILYQFFIFVVIFTLLKHLFFNKLLFVLQTRESKTTKLDEQAGEKFKQAEKLSAQFEREIQKTSEEAHAKMAEMKNSSAKKINEKQKAREAEVLADYEKKKKEAITEVESNKAKVLSAASELSDNLVSKLV